MQDIAVRPETPADVPAVRAVLEASFDRPAEADLVDRLREHPDTRVLVAEVDGGIAGCVVFSAVTLAGCDAVLRGLGPLAIAPYWQGQGVGTLLMQRGIADCQAAGADAIVVLGHPAYYHRFDFRAAHPLGLRCRWVVPEDAFMVRELRPGALAGARGCVEYLPDFDDV